MISYSDSVLLFQRTHVNLIDLVESFVGILAQELCAAFEMGRRLILFDVDGTLTLPRKVIEDRVGHFIKSLRDIEDIDVGVVGGSDLKKQMEQIMTVLVVPVGFGQSSVCNSSESA